MKFSKITKSLVFKVIVSYLICLVVVVSALTIYSYIAISEYLKEGLAEKSSSQIEILDLKCQNLLSVTEQITYDISYMISTLSSKLSSKDVYEALIENLFWNKNIESITLALLSDKDKTEDFKSANIRLNLKDRNVVMSYGYSDNSDFAVISKKNFCNEDWFNESLKSENHDGKWFSEYFSEGLMSYVYPIYTIENNIEVIIGVIRVDMKIQWLIDLMQKIKIYETGFCTFVSSDGDMLMRDGKVVNVIEEASLKKDSNNHYKELLKKIMVNSEQRFEYYHPTLDETFIIMTYPYKTWWFGIVVPRDEFYQLLIQRIFRLLVVGLICLVVPISIIIWLTLRQTGSLSLLTKTAEEIGNGNFDSYLPKLKSGDEIGTLSNAFVKMREDIKAHIENIRIMTEAKKQIEDELDIARRIQMSIIPSKFPEINKIDFYAFIKPAKTVGGDFYDFFFIDQKHFCFMVGDVSGKSISAAMFMAMSRTMIRSKLTSGLSLKETINQCNHAINQENSTGMFLTLFAAVLDIQSGKLEFCNAGHCPPAISRKSEHFFYLVSQNPKPAMGILNYNYDTEFITLSKGDIIFTYTDGVTEAYDSEHNLFEENKLKKVLDESLNLNISEILCKVNQSVLAHQGLAEQSDDICMIGLKYKGF